MKAEISLGGTQYLNHNNKHPTHVSPQGDEGWNFYNFKGYLSRDNLPCHILSNGEFALIDQKQHIVFSRTGQEYYYSKEIP